MLLGFCVFAVNLLFNPDFSLDDGMGNPSGWSCRNVWTWAGVPFKTKGVPVVDMQGWKSAYAYDYRDLTPERFREIEAAAGCFFYVDELLPVSCNGRLLALHCGTGGPKKIRLPRKVAKVVDLMDGRTVARDAVEFTDTFATPDTKLYELVEK